MEQIETNPNPDSRLEIKKQLFIDVANKVLTGEYKFADAAVRELTQLDPEKQDELIQELLSQLPTAEVKNHINAAIGFYDEGDTGNAISWLGAARDSLRKWGGEGSFDEDTKNELDELFMGTYREVYSKIN
jgi:hypothetical protein